ncbi:MAG: hypothetical protein C4518_07560 [Desulfobacteraceae bacterium]|nr:MAG: hypothetical protein C4518_07560 [Desulfobacteraceae bacterium]
MKSIPFFILMAYLFLCLQNNLGVAAPEIVGATGLIVILIGMGLVINDKSGNGWSPTIIMAFAAVFRLMFLWRTPELSDDIFRYIFDGMMTVSGHNPYALAPANVLPSSPQMHGLISQVNHPHLITIYPPAAQLVFALGCFTGGVFGMKLVLVLFDLATCGVIIKLLTHLRLPVSHAALYAWHPLPVIETGASGHIDATAVFFLLSAFLIILSTSNSKKAADPTQTGSPATGCFPFAAGVIISFSIFTKWMPVIFLPCFLIIAFPKKRRHVFSGILITSAILLLLFLPDFTNSLNTLTTYLQRWEFSGYLFRNLREMTGSGKTARLICVSLFMAVSGMVYVQIFLKNHPVALFKGCYVIAFAFLILTPTLHPWYALYLAAFLPFAGGPAGLVFSWSVFLSYRVMMAYGLTGQWVETGGVPLWVVSAPAAAAGVSIILKFLNGKAINSNSRRANPEL